jgi:flagellar biosynthesis anti-sigma factor FlgM
MRMDIRNGLDGLRSILGPAQAAPAAAAPKSTSSAAGEILGTDQATLSSAGSKVSLAASEAGVRADKVAAIQTALAAGIYHVPASAVASRLVDAMLGAER